MASYSDVSIFSFADGGASSPSRRRGRGVRPSSSFNIQIGKESAPPPEQNRRRRAEGNEEDEDSSGERRGTSSYDVPTEQDDV